MGERPAGESARRAGIGNRHTLPKIARRRSGARRRIPVPDRQADNRRNQRRREPDGRGGRRQGVYIGLCGRARGRPLRHLVRRAGVWSSPKCRRRTKRNSKNRAAGRIHSNMERGFIRAEVIGFDDMTACDGETEARKHGPMRKKANPIPRRTWGRYAHTV